MGHHGEHLIRNRDKNIHQASHSTAKLANTDYLDSRFFIPFESHENILNKIMQALQDDDTHIVGLYGMGGTGKTTLAKELGDRVKMLNFFNTVLFMTVSERPNIRKIRDEIAEGLGLKLGEESNLVARQRQISARLLRSEEERILVILDDVMEKLDLEKIGIPCDGNGHPTRGKVLLITRDNYLLYSNGCQHNFHHYLVNDEDAWTLFKRCAGITDANSPDAISLAKVIAKKCQALPLAIVLIGASLRGKTVDEWKVVSKTLYNPKETVLDWADSSFDFMEHVVHLGYDGLSSQLDKLLFFMCVLFPEDHEILIEDLSQYAIRLGLCGKNEVHSAINSLINHGFLMRAGTSVIMHDIVRKMARHIVVGENREHKDSIHKYLSALQNHETSQDTDEIFYWYKEFDKLLLLLYSLKEGPSDLPDVVHSPPTYAAATIPKPSGKMVDFNGLCKVDKSFLPLLKEACERKPQLIESQKGHSEMLRQTAFESLGRLLFLLHNVRIRDWVYLKHELQIFWEQSKVMKFDLEWLSPIVEGVLSSPEIARIEALQEEQNNLIEEAAKLRQRLRLVEDKVAFVKTEIAHSRSKLDGFAIADVSGSEVVSKVTPRRRTLFRK